MQEAAVTLGRKRVGVRLEKRQQIVAGLAAIERFCSPAWWEVADNPSSCSMKHGEKGARPVRRRCKGLEQRAWARGLAVERRFREI